MVVSKTSTAWPTIHTAPGQTYELQGHSLVVLCQPVKRDLGRAGQIALRIYIARIGDKAGVRQCSHNSTIDMHHTVAIPTPMVLKMAASSAVSSDEAIRKAPERAGRGGLPCFARKEAVKPARPSLQPAAASISVSHGGEPPQPPHQPPSAENP